MKCIFRSTLLASCMVLASGTAHAAIACATVTATNVAGVYVPTANLDLTGSITVTCTRLGTDPTTQVIYISLNQGEPPNGRNMTRQTAADLLTYTILRNATPNGSWTTGTGRAPGATQAGGLQVTFDFSTTGTLSKSVVYPYYFRVASGFTTKPAGIYDDQLITATVRLGSSGGAIQSTTIFETNVSIPAVCYFSTAPTAMAISYTAFSATARTATSNFNASCTMGTPYTLAITPATAVLVGLQYNMTLSSASSTGTGFAQTHTATATVPAGQAGNCATGTCNASQSHTITVSY